MARSRKNHFSDLAESVPMTKPRSFSSAGCHFDGLSHTELSRLLQKHHRDSHHLGANR